MTLENVNHLRSVHMSTISDATNVPLSLVGLLGFPFHHVFSDAGPKGSIEIMECSFGNDASPANRFQSKKSSRSLSLHGGTSCFANGRPLHRLIAHSSAVSSSNFRMFTRRYRVGFSGCGLNKMPLVPKLRLPLLRRHFVGFPRSTCDFVPTSHGLARAAVLLHALTMVCVFSSISLHNLRNSSFVLSGNDVSRFDNLGLLD